MNKKVLVSLVFSLIIVSFLISLSSATELGAIEVRNGRTYEWNGAEWADVTSILGGGSTSSGIVSNTQQAIDVISNELNPILKFVLGDISGNDIGDLFLVKLLVFILILSIVYFAATRVPGLKDYRSVVWVVSIIVSILGVRLLTTKALVNLIWLPTGSLAIALLVAVIFIIFFLFIESFDNSVIRKVCWIIFLVLFLALAIYRWDELAVQGGAGKWWNNLAWWYIIIVILSLIMILFDKRIRRFYTLNALKIKASEHNVVLAQSLFDQIDAWEKVRVSRHSSDKEKKDAATAIVKLRREIAELKSE